MSTIANIYKSKFKESLSPLGFRLYRQTFYRVAGDVIHMLMLSNWDSDYTIEHQIRPLCLELQDLEVAGNAIHEYRKGDFQHKSKQWQIRPCPYTGEKPPDEVLESYVDEMLSIVHAHLIPYFDSVTDWESWLKKQKDGHYGVWTLIKLGEYEKASIIYQKRIDQNQDRLQRYHADPDDPYELKKDIQLKLIKEKNYDFFLARRIAAEIKALEDIESYTKMLERLSIPDTDYFEKVFAENITKNLEYLDNLRKYKQKHGY